MVSKQTAVRLPEITLQQIEQLRERFGYRNATQVMIVAIDRMFRDMCPDEAQEKPQEAT